MLPPVPTDTRQAQTVMLYDLIEKSNPGFKVSYPAGSVVFGVPSAIAIDPEDPYKNDTTVRVSPAPGAAGFGTVSVNYRRIDLAKRFKGMTVKLTNYQVSNSATTPVWVGWLAEKYGLSVTSDDLSSQVALGSGSNTAMTMKAGSLCYKGSVQVYWTKSLAPLNTIITNANKALTGRLYPGGNDFTTPGRKPQGEFLAYCQDATSVGSIIEGMTNGTQPDASPIMASVVEWLLSTTSRTDWSVKNSNGNVGGVGALGWFKYSLPNAAIPEANSAKYNRCLVIQSTALSWFAGKIIIHYNV